MESQGEYITVGPRDFIREPHIKCPKCGKISFGVLGICDNHYGRRCKECLYPRPGDPPELYPLPELKKKVVYVDQPAISNMMKSLNPEANAYQKGTIDPFWGEAFDRLDTLCKLQLLICPSSLSHLHESSLAPRLYEPLRRMSQLLSYGISFYDHTTIQRFQILQQLEVFLGEKKEMELDVHTMTMGNLNAWQPRWFISLKIDNSQEMIDAIRKNRERAADGFENVFHRWQVEKDKDFDYWYEEERNAWAWSLVESYEKFCKDFVMASLKLAPFQVADLLPNTALTTFHSVREKLKQKGVDEKSLDKRLGEFLWSDAFRNAPFIKISSMMFAAMARRASSGRQRPPTKGFITDVQIVSTLLPYCDAVFLDNECRSLLAEPPLSEMIDYGTKIFSVSNQKQFIDYLDDIKSSASEEHLEKVKEVYGPEWAKPFRKLYQY